MGHVEEAVREEMDGRGRLLGYRALHKKVREVHGLKVPRNLVYAMMENVDSSGLEERGGVGQPKRPVRLKDLYRWYKIIALCFLNILLISFSYLCNECNLRIKKRFCRVQTIPCHLIYGHDKRIADL